VLDWFDRWILGKETGAARGVRYWQLGVDEWREAPGWPPTYEEQRWYLHSNGDASRSTTDGFLSTETPDAGEPSDRFEYDPADPTPTVGGKTLMPTILGAGIKNRAAVAERHDVVVYTSAPFEAELEVAGPVSVELWASSSAVDTDFVAHLVDIGPDSYCAGLAEGIVRARYRHSTQSRSPLLTPGDLTEFHIDLWDIAHTFRPGHRMRVEIASCNFPRFDRNLNTAAGADPAIPFGSESLEDAVVATQHIAHDAGHRSCIVLPVSRP
jgi:putative CocE/NonD family hydrolase